MTASPWHGSRFFLLGLVGLVMLSGTWAWTARMDTRETVFLQWRGLAFSMDWGGSEIFAGLFYSWTGPVATRHFGHYGEGITPHDQQWFPIFKPGFSHNAGWTDFGLGVRLWFLTLVYIICWSVALVWWQHRKHRLSK